GALERLLLQLLGQRLLRGQRALLLRGGVAGHVQRLHHHLLQVDGPNCHPQLTFAGSRPTLARTVLPVPLLLGTACSTARSSSSASSPLPVRTCSRNPRRRMMALVCS